MVVIYSQQYIREDEILSSDYTHLCSAFL